MKKWEYQNMWVRQGEILEAAEVNKLGAEGWELVSVYEYKNNQIAAILKREIKK
jgi:hypothetical protein